METFTRLQSESETDSDSTSEENQKTSLNDISSTKNDTVKNEEESDVSDEEYSDTFEIDSTSKKLSSFHCKSSKASKKVLLKCRPRSSSDATRANVSGDTKSNTDTIKAITLNSRSYDVLKNERKLTPWEKWMIDKQNKSLKPKLAKEKTTKLFKSKEEIDKVVKEWTKKKDEQLRLKTKKSKENKEKLYLENFLKKMETKKRSDEDFKIWLQEKKAEEKGKVHGDYNFFLCR